MYAYGLSKIISHINKFTNQKQIIIKVNLFISLIMFMNLPILYYTCRTSTICSKIGRDYRAN